MTSELILILRDFFARSEAPEPESTPARLPALESLLAMADRAPLPDGWRASLAGRFATTEVAAMAPAAAPGPASTPAKRPVGRPPKAAVAPAKRPVGRPRTRT